MSHPKNFFVNPPHFVLKKISKHIKVEHHMSFFQFILDNKHKNLEWDWFAISTNPNITWEIVMSNPTEPWNWQGLSRNPSITWEIIKNNPTMPWDYYNLGKNPNINFEIVKNNLDRPWNFRGLSWNSNITLKILKDNKDRPWSWIGLFKNVNIGRKVAEIFPEIQTQLNLLHLTQKYKYNENKRLSKKNNCALE